jgi:hypothetical protein
MRRPSSPRPDPAPDRVPAPRVPDDAVDAFFDRELDPHRSRDMLAGLKNDPARSEEIARTQRMLSLLRRTPLHAERAEEDLLGAIMARVDRRRRFLPEAWRRFVTAGRLATAATLLLAGFGVAVLGRIHPDALRWSPQPAPIATLVDTSRTELAESAARCCVTLETISDHAAPLMQVRGTFVPADGSAFAPDASSFPLRPGVLAAVRFAGDRTDLHVTPGSGEPVSGPMGASFALGLELVSSRQRSGASAPVFLPTHSPDRSTRTFQVRPITSVSSAVFSPLSGPVLGQFVTVGDHTVLVPATLDGPGWPGGPGVARRLLLIQASPSDLFPPR